MAKKWIKEIKPAVGTPVIELIPAGVGTVRVVHDFTSGGTADVDFTYDLPSAALAGSPYAWTALIDGGGADKHSDVLTAHVTAVKLTSLVTVQRFLLVGENHDGR